MYSLSAFIWMVTLSRLGFKSSSFSQIGLWQWRVTWDRTANCQYASECKQHSCWSLGSRLTEPVRIKLNGSVEIPLHGLCLSSFNKNECYKLKIPCCYFVVGEVHWRTNARKYSKETERYLFFNPAIKNGIKEFIRKHEKHEILSVLMLCAPSNRRRPFSCHTKMADFRVFSCFVRFLVKKNWHKLRKVYWIWQVATVRSINHNMGALKELSCQM